MKLIPKPTNIKIAGLLILAFLLFAFDNCNAEVFVDHQRLAQETGCFKCHYMPPQNQQTQTASQPVVDPRIKEGAGSILLFIAIITIPLISLFITDSEPGSFSSLRGVTLWNFKGWDNIVICIVIL